MPIARSFGKMAIPLRLGEDLAAADIQMSFVGELAAASANISEYPNIDRWVRRYQDRTAYKAAIEKGGYYKFQR
jgi:glutathione S-transferase